MPTTQPADNAAAIRVERDGPLAWLVLNRPERHNALTPGAVAGFIAALDELEADDVVKVIAIRGEGESFCAGFDIAPDADAVHGVTANDSVQEYGRLRANLTQLFKVWDCSKPVIAAVHGACLAGGSMLATLCDITVVADDARIGVSSLPLGGGYITPVWMHLIGPKRAKQMAFQPGETMSGNEAAQWGWANFATPAETLLAEVRALASRISRTPSSTLQMKKIAINRMCELQGFRAQAMLGAEIDALLHFSTDTKAVWESVAADGLKATIKNFRGGAQ